MSVLVRWVGPRPEDTEDWERIVHKAADNILGSGVVVLRAVGADWLVEGARKLVFQTYSVAVGGTIPPAKGSFFDGRWHVTKALREAGKPVVGTAKRSGEPPLSSEREAAIRWAVASVINADAILPDDMMQFEAQVVADLLAEVDRLRAKLQLAAHARDLTGQAASRLRDACEDITATPTRSFERATPRRSSPPDPNE